MTAKDKNREANIKFIMGAHEKLSVIRAAILPSYAKPLIEQLDHDKVGDVVRILQDKFKTLKVTIVFDGDYGQLSAEPRVLKTREFKDTEDYEIQNVANHLRPYVESEGGAPEKMYWPEARDVSNFLKGFMCVSNRRHMYPSPFGWM